MATITTIIRLLPILVEYEVVKLIGDLNQVFNFDHNIFLLDSSLNMNRFISRQGVIPQSVYTFKSVNDNITGLESLTNITSKNTFMVIVTKDANFDNNLNLVKRVKEIQKLQINMKIGIFFPHFATSDDLKNLFQWCKEQLIPNIFAATYVTRGLSPDDKLNIFAFHPFGKFEVKNVTGSARYNNYFPSLNSNFQQHQLRMTQTFFYYSRKELYRTVFRLMNASFVIVQVDYVENMWSKLEENEIDIYPELYYITQFTEMQKYPLSMGGQVIIVPEAQPYPEFSAYLKAVTSDDFFGYSVITIAAVMILLSVIRYIKQKNILFFQSVTDVLNLLMNDNGYINYQRLSSVEVFIILPLTFLGLVIVNGFLSNLQSYLTRPILQPQINSIEDIYKSPYHIHVLGPTWKLNLTDVLTNLTKHEDWNDKIIELENKEFMEQSETFNTSKSFLLSLEKIDLLLRVQKRLNIKGFHNTQIKIFNVLVTDLIFDKFLFHERLDEIIHRIKSAGLYDLWLLRDYLKYEKKILKKNVERLQNENENVVNNFEFPMIIAYGWLAGVIVLVIEIIWKNFKLIWIWVLVWVSKLRKYCKIVATKFETFCKVLAEKFGR